MVVTCFVIVPMVWLGIEMGTRAVTEPVAVAVTGQTVV
jgi:hypothetical protein